MQVTAQTPRAKRTIGQSANPAKNLAEIKFEVEVPQPFVPGPIELTEGMANALNQTIAENLSNNLRAKLIDGRPEVKADEANGVAAEPARPYTAEEAQALVDSYIADYEIGVRRAGNGEPRVTDPVEREARAIARLKAVELVKANGGKPSDYDMAPITESIFTANRDVLMAEGKRIVQAKERARTKDGISLEGISLPTAKPAEPAAAAA